MKKVTSVFMAFVLLLALTACNSGGGSGGAKAEIKGETKEVGDFSVLVPEGWMGYDMELSGEPITYKTQIYKGAKEEIDMWSTPSSPPRSMLSIYSFSLCPGRPYIRSTDTLRKPALRMRW